MDTWAAAVYGVLGAMAMHGFSTLALKYHVDDPVDAFAVHAGSGLTGLLLTGLFALPHSPSDTINTTGLVYSGDFYSLGIQLLGGVIIAG